MRHCLIIAFTLLAHSASAQSALQSACYDADPVNNPQVALSACDALVSSNPVDQQIMRDALHFRGIAKRETGDLAGSIADFEGALEIDPNSTAVMRMLAWTYREMDEPARAESLYDRVLEIDDHWQGWLSRCVVKSDQENYLSAAADCEEALARDPENLDALFFGARAYTFSDNPALALPIAQRAVALAPDDPRHAGELVWAMYLAGNPDQALREARAFLEIFPNDSELSFFLTQVE